LQQTLCPSIAQVFFAFSRALNLRGQRSKYKADENVRCLRLVRAECGTDRQLCLVDIKPNAALTFFESLYVMAMMELKAEIGKSVDDMVKCVVMTSASALALKEAFDARPAEGGEVQPARLYFPFVIGQQEKAILYATCLNHDVSIEVIEVCDAGMTGSAEQEKKCDLLAILRWLL